MQTEGVNDRVQLARTGPGDEPPDRDPLDARPASRSWTRRPPGSTPTSCSTRTSRCCPASSCSARPSSARTPSIGPDTTLKDCEVGAGARVVRTHGELAVIGGRRHRRPVRLPAARHRRSAPAARSAPSSRPRTPRSATAPRCRTCPTSATPRSARAANIGAGTIFANYDGVAKHRTMVGKHARTGANNTFVAPVEIGDGAGTGGRHRRTPATSRRARSRSAAGPQRNLEGWALTKRAGHRRRRTPRRRRLSAVETNLTDTAADRPTSRRAEEQQP